MWSWDPDAFGMTQPTGSVQINLRFPGQVYDEQSGLYYNHNRYYNPQLGRYMEADPSGLEGGLNPYAYAGNNPVINVDPSGLFYTPSGLIPLNNNQLSMAHVGTDLLDLSMDYAVNNFINKQNNYKNYSSMQAMSFSTVVKVTPIAGGLAVSDGPFPFGDTAALIIVGGATGYDIYKNWNSPAILNENGEPASEQTAKDIGRKVGKDLGRDAQRDFHDMKEPGAPDRTLDQLKSDAEELYERYGKPVPNWLKR